MKHASSRRTRGLRAVAAALTSTLPMAAFAGGGNWLNTTNSNNDWATGSNWSSNAAPSSTDSVAFNQAATYNVSFSSADTSGNINLSAGMVTCNLGSQSLTAQSLTIGNGSFIQNGGTLDLGGGTINVNSGGIYTLATGTAVASVMNINNGGEYLWGTVNGFLVNPDINTVNLNAGGLLSYSATVGGGYDSFPNLLMNGGTAWNIVGANNFTYTSGNASSASISVSNAFTLTGSMSASQVILDGSLSLGNNTLTVNDLATFSSTSIQSSGAIVAAYDSEYGQASQTGGTRTVTASFEIGTGDSYNLQGGTLSISTLKEDSGSTFNWTGGTLNLTGSSLTIGSNGSLGSVVNLGSGKTLQIGGSGQSLSINSNGIVNLSGGTLITPSYSIAAGGALNWTAGTMDLTGTSVVLTSGGLLGLNPSLNNNQTLQITGTGQNLNIPGGSLTFNGGTSSTPTVLFAPAIYQSGGSVTDSGALTLSGSGGNAVTYYLGGGTLSANTLNVGTGGSLNASGGAAVTAATFNASGGVATISGGASVSTSTDVYIAYVSSATLNVTGTNSKFSSSGSDLLIGSGASTLATVNVTNGGQITGFHSVYLGTSSATVNLNIGSPAGNDSGGSLVLLSGNLDVPNNIAQATVNVYAGGTLQIGAALNGNADGQVNLQGGTINTGSLSLASPSQFNWSSGTLNISNSSMVIGTGGPLGSSLTLGSTQSLNLTGSGQPNLNVTGSLDLNGGNVSTPEFYVGNSNGTNGSVTISGGGHATTTYDTTIGEYGGTGSLTVTGAGSTLNDTTYGLYVGYSRDVVGSTDYGPGIGTLNISNGGQVTVAAGILIGDLGGTGSFTVDGANSKLACNNGSLYVGYTNYTSGSTNFGPGNGTLMITDGGQVSATTYLGCNGGTGTIVVGKSSGDTGGSTLSGGNLYIGQNSAGAGTGGTLVINSGSTATFSQGVYTYSGGTAQINLSGGTLSAGSLSLASPSQFNWSSGTLKITASSLTVGSGSGSTSAVSWGNNGYGQLGNGNTTNSNAPASVAGLSSGVTAVSAGSTFSLALQNGKVYSWGANFNGQLGNGSGSNSDSPVALSGLASGVSAIAAGGAHGLAIQNGGVYAWGSNIDGQLGNGTTTNSNAPVAVTGLSSGVTAIAASGTFSLAVRNGGVYAWGYGSDGELGNGSTNNSSTPVAVSGMSSGVTAIAAGGSGGIGLKGGGVYAWGDNYYGELGNGSSANNSTTPVAVTGLSTGVTAIAAGGIHYLAVDNGNVYAWGDNEHGQLGDGTTNDEDIPEKVPGIGGSILAITASARSSYALAADGSIWDWGDNSYGELGLGTTTSVYTTPQHLLPPTGYQYTSISAEANGYTLLTMLTSAGSSSSGTGLATNLTITPSMALQVTGVGQSVNVAGTLNLTGGSITTPSMTVQPSGIFNWTSGTLNITGAGASSIGSLTIPAGGILNLYANVGSGILVRNLGGITLSAGSAQMNVLGTSNSHNRQLIVMPGLALAGSTGAWQGMLNLIDNDMDVQGGQGSSLSNITSQVKQAYNGGDWSGAAGIFSSYAAANTTHLTTLGVIQNNQSGSALYTTFDTYGVGATDILVKYTYYGDTNLDGQVDGSDYSRIDAASLADKTNPTALTGWFNGDFNYDGVVNGSDYTLIDNAFNTQGGALSSEVASVTAQIVGLDGTNSPVPEPAAFGLLGITLSTSLCRRRLSILRAP